MSETLDTDRLGRFLELSKLHDGIECFLSKSEVSTLVGISGRTLQSMMSSGAFPKPDKYIGPMPKWRISTYNEWSRKKNEKKGE